MCTSGIAHGFVRFLGQKVVPFHHLNPLPRLFLTQMREIPKILATPSTALPSASSSEPPRSISFHSSTSLGASSSVVLMNTHVIGGQICMEGLVVRPAELDAVCADAADCDGGFVNGPVEH